MTSRANPAGLGELRAFSQILLEAWRPNAAHVPHLAGASARLG